MIPLSTPGRRTFVINTALYCINVWKMNERMYECRYKVSSAQYGPSVKTGGVVDVTLSLSKRGTVVPQLFHNQWVSLVSKKV